MTMPTGPPGGASALSSVFTLLNSAVGAGVLSLPFAFYAAGWAGGLLATAAVAAIEAFTLYVLARYAEVTGSATYSGLVRKMLGRKASAAMSIVLIIYSYGSATAYLIILGDCFQPMLEQAFGQAWWTERNAVILALSTAFMLPLCFPRTLHAISGFSSVTFYALLVVVGSVVYRATEALRAPGYDWGALRAWRPLGDALDSLPILAFGFQCHTNLVAVFSELEEEPELFGSTASLSSLLGAGGGAEAGADASAADGAATAENSTAPGGSGQAGQGGAQAPEERGLAAPREGEGQVRVVLLRRPQRRFVAPARRTPKLVGMVQVVCASLGISAAFYCLVGLFGYASFPTNTRSNILLNYPNSDRLMQVAKVLVGIIQVIHYPVNHAPARNATRDLLTQLTGRSPLFRGYNTVEVLLFFVSTLGLSLLVTDLGEVFKLIGGSCGAFFIFGMPGALLIQYAWSKHEQVRQGHPLEQPLLAEEGSAGGAGTQHVQQAAQQVAAQQAQQRYPPERYHVLLSKLFWAGVLLILLALGLLGLTLYTLLAPPV